MTTHAYLPVKATITAIAKVIEAREYADMSVEQFVAAVMAESGGGANPKQAAVIGAALIGEANQ